MPEEETEPEEEPEFISRVLDLGDEPTVDHPFGFRDLSLVKVEVD